MKKSISNATLLSVLFLLGACSTTDSDQGNVEESSSTSIMNSALAGAFTGTANDQSAIVNATAGTAGIEPGGIIITSGANGVLTSVGSTAVTFADADNNTSAQQNSAMQQAVKTAVDAILRVSDNTVVGLSKGSIVVVKLSDLQKAEATVTLSTTDGYVFEDKKNTRTFVIVLTSSDLHTSNILNTKLVGAFTGAANDKSTTINETAGTAGIESGEIIITSDANGVFTSVSSTVTVSDSDNTPERQISAMQNSVKTAVDAILRVSDNTVVGLSTESTVVVKPYGTQTSLAIATVTLSTTGDYLFEDNSNIKTFVIALTISKVQTYSVLNTKLATTFTGTANDKSTTINEATGTAGIASGGITINSDARGVLTSVGNTAVTFADADNTSERQISAMKNSVKKAVDAILKVSDNTVLGLSTESTVVVNLLSDAQKAEATVTLSTTGEYLFEDKRNTRTFVIVLTSSEVQTYSVLNTKLATTFTGTANDKSTTINEATGTAGIASGGITINSDARGVLTSVGNTAVTFADADNTSERQISAMKNSVKKAVDAILKVSDNTVLGLSTESTVVVNLLSDAQKAEATVTLSTTGEYLFEDKRNTRTFVIVLTSLDIKSIIDPSAFNVPATTAIQGTAGTASFTIPIGFDDVTAKVPTYFHNKDNLLYNEKKNAITKAFESMSTPTGVQITAVEEDIRSSKVTVTFGAKDGYKFIDSSSSKKFTIHLSGFFGDSQQTIEEPAYSVKGFGAIPNGIHFNPGFVQKGLVYATVRGNVNNQKIAVMQALDQMFYDASSFAPLLPEGIKYTKTSPRARVKLDSKGNPMLYDNQGHFIITLPRLDDSYIFNQADQAKKEITIKVQWIPGY